MTSNNSSEPSQLNGNLNSIKGQVYEQIGNVTGSKDWQTSGQQIHAQGEAEQKAAQGKALAEGLTDQVSGYAQSVKGAVLGDKSDQLAGNARKEAGSAQVDANKPQ
ncbi:unnamed protein product [Parajaminaea phylloscopi]